MKCESEEPLVSIIIPTYNRSEKLNRLLKSIYNSIYSNFEIIVIDDASNKGTYKELDKSFPEIKLIRNNEERFLAASRNIGICNSKGKFIFLIDDDNVIAEDTITELINMMMNDDKIGVVGPLMFYYTVPDRIWCAGVKINYWTSKTTFIGRDELYNKKLYKIMPSDCFPNAFMVRKKTFDNVGLFDNKNFPIHYDEGDFCNRVKRDGWKILVIPTAMIWHDMPYTKENGISIRSLHMQNMKRTYYVARNRLIFHKKYSHLIQWIVLLFFMPLFNVFYIIKILMSDKKYLINSYLKGIIDGLIWKPS